MAMLTSVGLGVSGCGGSVATTASAPASSSTTVDTADLSSLIEAENAAVYAYGVIGAHLTGAPRDRALKALKAHRQLRDDWILAAQAAGQQPPPAALAYDLPFDVSDRRTAEALSIEIETRLIAVYESAGVTASDALTKARARLAQMTSN